MTPPQVCSCGMDLPSHLASLAGSDFTHTCTCNRVYVVENGLFSFTGEYQENPFAQEYTVGTNLKTYYSKPKTIEAVHFEEAGTYDVFGTKIEVKADTYAYMRDGHLMTVSGDRFRADWDPEYVDQLVAENNEWMVE